MDRLMGRGELLWGAGSAGTAQLDSETSMASFLECTNASASAGFST